MKTGTANYLDKLLAPIAKELAAGDDVCIVIDSRDSALKLPDSIQGIPLVDIEAVPAVVPADELWFVFIANNTFHAYVHRALDECTLNAGRVITVVHEPANYMLIRHLSYHGEAGFAVDRLQRGMEIQYGVRAGRFLQDANAGNLPPIFDYITNAQHGLYTNSSEIWTHSMYAAQRLLLEHPGEAPPIRVYSHPHTHFDFDDDPKRLPASLQKSDGKFRIGMFGWVSEPKRVSEAIEALGLALDRLPPAAVEHIEFYVVGQLPPAGGYDPVHKVEMADVRQNVRFLSYVENRNFELLFRTCDCILNLRFPSCGETSGTLALAHSAGVKVIKSNYQAMHEEKSPMAISTLPFFEVAMLASQISDLYLEWAAGKETSGDQADESTSSFGCPVEKAVLLEVRKHRHVRNMKAELVPRRTLA